MSRFVQGFDSNDARVGGGAISASAGGTVINNVTSSVTPSTTGAVAIKSQTDTLAAAGGQPQNGVRVFSLLAAQASGWYGHSATCACNWTVPSDVCRVFIQVWGGGGGGGSFCTKNQGTPGGAGGYTHGFFSVTPGDILCTQAGRGGCRGCCCLGNGFNGVISFVCNATRSIQIRAYPGTGGRYSFGTYSGEGGCYGCGVGGQLNLCGQREHTDTHCSCHRYCDGRQKAFLVGGGPQAFGGYVSAATGVTMFCGSTCGMPNCSPGGGGAHSGVSYPTTAKGGAGGPGLVMIWH